MRLEEVQARRMARAREHRRRVRRRRLVALAGVIIPLAVVGVVIASAGGGTKHKPALTATRHKATRKHHAGAPKRGKNGSTVVGQPTGRPGTTPVPVLMYHVIAPPPTGAPFPGLYVPADEFAAQMQALKDAGWHPVTLDQLEAYWTKGVPLGPGKPIVLTFDNGYRSQYVNALPVLKRLGWVADENIQLAGLPPSQGGLTTDQVKGMINAGWELDTQGISHADLITLGPTELHDQVAVARQRLQQQYGVPVNWFCYPSGHYDDTVVAAVKSAGFVGSTTVVPGWAGPSNDPYRLPRLRILGGTSPSAMLAQIASAQHATAPGDKYP